MTCNPLAARRFAGPVCVSVLLAVLAGCATAPAPKPVVTDLSDHNQPPTDAPAVPARNEVALNDGEEVVANTPAGKISISAGPGLLRTYSWGGTTRWVVMNPRQKRWAGSLGLYYEGTPPDWAPYQGLSKVDLAEGERHFETLSDAMIWMQIRRLHFVYSHDGLVVGWRPRPSKDTLQVEVWQFFIDGQKPAHMPGSQDYLIRVSRKPYQSAAR